MKRAGSPLLLIAACLFAALAPLWPVSPSAPDHGLSFPGWPATIEGHPLRPRALSPAEERFAAGFPGRLASFDDGARSVLLRFVTRPTRRLHPAVDCYRAAGYETEPRPAQVDAEGRLWGCFQARREEKRWLVCESIRDDAGSSWSDVSSWYWSAALGDSNGPWWTTTLAEPVS